MHIRRTTCLLFVSVLAGCAGIPELAFEPDASDDGSRSGVDANVASDGRADAGASVDAAGDDGATDAESFDADVLDGSGHDGSPADSSVEDAHDGATLDASDHDASDHDASDHDASDHDAGGGDDGGLTCPAGPPPGASVCCKGVPCHGAAPSCHSECVNCANNCAGQTCCLDQNGNYHGCAKSPADCPP